MYYSEKKVLKSFRFNNENYVGDSVKQESEDETILLGHPQPQMYHPGNSKTTIKCSHSPTISQLLPPKWVRFGG